MSMNTTSAASELMAIVGPGVMQQVCDAFGGQTIYIPHTAPDPERDHRICTEFNEVIHESASVGSAYIHVGVTEGVSPRTVQRVICGRN